MTPLEEGSRFRRGGFTVPALPPSPLTSPNHLTASAGQAAASLSVQTHSWLLSLEIRTVSPGHLSCLGRPNLECLEPGWQLALGPPALGPGQLPVLLAEGPDAPPPISERVHGVWLGLLQTSLPNTLREAVKDSDSDVGSWIQSFPLLLWKPTKESNTVLSASPSEVGSDNNGVLLVGLRRPGVELCHVCRELQLSVSYLCL